MHGVTFSVGLFIVTDLGIIQDFFLIKFYAYFVFDEQHYYCMRQKGKNSIDIFLAQTMQIYTDTCITPALE